MSLKKTSLVTMKIAASLASISLLVSCGSDQQFGALDGATTLKSSSGSQDLASRDQMGVTPVVDENGNLKDPRGEKDKDCKDPRPAPTAVPSQPPRDPQPPKDPQPQPPKEPQPNRGGVCGNYPLYPGVLRADPGANSNFRAIIHGKPQAGMTEAYRFEMYNASNMTHGWVPLSAGLKLDRYSAVMVVDVPAESKNPVVLALHAYEPTLWKINDPAGRVRFVDVTGYHCQTVEGVSQGKVLSRSYEAGSNDVSARPADGVLIKTQNVYEGASIGFIFKAGI